MSWTKKLMCIVTAQVTPKGKPALRLLLLGLYWSSGEAWELRSPHTSEISEGLSESLNGTGISLWGKNGNKAGEGRRSGGVLRTDQQSVLSKGGKSSPGENLQPHLLQWWVWKLGRAGVESEPREAPAKVIPEKELPGAAWKYTVASAIEIFSLSLI